MQSLEMIADEPRIADQCDQLQKMLQSTLPNLAINGDLANWLAGNLHISIPGIFNSAVIARIRHQLAISAGSACSSGIGTPSHVSRALGLPEPVIKGSLRIGLGKFTTNTEINQAAEIPSQAILEIQQKLGCRS